MRSRVPLITAILATLLLIPPAASGAFIDEQHQGQSLIAQVQAGTKTCNDLSAQDLDHVGEYVMFRALGSTQLHATMNARMRLMLGEQGESRMHQLLGARYIGCSTAATGSMMGGGGMMGGYLNNGGWGAMMGSGGWAWMMGGNWQNMTRQDWQRIRRQLGIPATTSGGGWSAPAIIAVTVCAALVVVLLAIILMRRRPFKQPPATASG